MKVVAADFRATGNEHLIVNSAFLEGLKSLNIEELDFFCEINHYNTLRSAFPEAVQNVSPHLFVRHYYSHTLKTLFFREILLPIKMFRVIRKARRANLLLITTNTPMGHFLLNFFVFALRSKTKCVVIMHSDLQIAFEPSASFYRFCMRSWLKTMRRRINHVVLSPHIQEKIAATLPAHANFHSTFHPFPRSLLSSQRGERSCNGDTKKIKIGIPGHIKSSIKGSDAIFALEKTISSAGRDDIELYLIGRAAREFTPPKATNVVMPFLHRADPVPQQEFDDALQEMDIILLPYKKESYTFAASGAVLDALKFGQPIFSVGNPLFLYMQQEGMFPGHLARDIDELFDVIAHRLDDEYLSQIHDDIVSSLQALELRTSPSANIQKLLKSILGECPV